jgi:hypothetical protein
VLGTSVGDSEWGLLDRLPPGPACPGAGGGPPGDLGCPRGAEGRRRGGARGIGMAEMPRPLHAQRVVEGPQGIRRHGGCCGTHHLRPALRRGGLRPTGQGGGHARPPVPQSRVHAGRPQGRPPCLRSVPNRALEKMLEHEPSRAGEQGDQAAHPTSSASSPTRQQSCALRAPCCWRSTTSGPSATAATSRRPPWQSFTKPARMRPSERRWRRSTPICWRPSRQR